MELSRPESRFRPPSLYSSEQLSKPTTLEAPALSGTTSANTGGGWRSDSYSLLLTELDKEEVQQKIPWLSQTARKPS